MGASKKTGSEGACAPTGRPCFGGRGILCRPAAARPGPIADIGPSSERSLMAVKGLTAMPELSGRLFDDMAEQAVAVQAFGPFAAGLSGR